MKSRVGRQAAWYGTPDDQMQQQFLKDSWLQTNVPGYQPNWLFLHAPPAPELSQYLSGKGIPYVIYH